MERNYIFKLLIFSLILCLSLNFVCASEDIGSQINDNLLIDENSIEEDMVSSDIASIDSAQDNSNQDSESLSVLSSDVESGDSVGSSDSDSLSQDDVGSDVASPDSSQDESIQDLDSLGLGSDVESGDCVGSSDSDSLSQEDIVSGNNFESIQTAVNNAKANDTIFLNGTYTGSGKLVNITKSLTFQGLNNAVLDAKSLSDIFVIKKNVNLTVKDVSFKNARTYAIADYSFNGIYSKITSKSVVKIYNCSFINSKYDEVLNDFWLGGAIYLPSVMVYDSNFTNNYGFTGGAIYGYNVTVRNCRFTKNRAYDNGGAITGYNVIVYSSEFTKNVCDSCYGGAIEAVNVKVYNSKFIKNKAAYDYHDDYLAGYGGAIFSEVCRLVNSSFINNSAVCDGGAVAVRGDENSSIENCIFTGNKASEKGGALYFYSVDVKKYTGKVKILNSKFTDNAAKYAGAIYAHFRLYITNSSFRNNNYSAIIANKTYISNPKLKVNYTGNVILGNGLKKTNLVNITITHIKTSYRSGKSLTVKLKIKGTKKVLDDLCIHFYRKGLVSEWSSTNSKGIYEFDISKFKAGTYKVLIENKDSYAARSYIPLFKKSFTIKITKAKTILKAPKVVNKYGKSKYFTISVKNKVTKKGVKSLKLKLKVYTGKKYRVYKVKTNKKGIYKLNTKKFSRGKHKVVISSLNANYIVKGKSKFIVK